MVCADALGKRKYYRRTGIGALRTEGTGLGAKSPVPNGTLWNKKDKATGLVLFVNAFQLSLRSICSGRPHGGGQ